MRLLPCIALLSPAHAVQSQEEAESQNQNGDIIVEAQSIEDKNNIVRASGNVRACFSQYTIQSDLIEYDRKQKIITAPNNIQLISPRQTIEGHSFIYNTSTQQGQVRGVNLLVGQDGLQASGDVARFVPVAQADATSEDSQTLPNIVIDNVDISSCKTESRAWVLEAGTLSYQDESYIAEDVSFRFYDLPIVYTPIYIIESSTRKYSGFLRPDAEIGNNGFNIESPFYVFLANNYDATITPKWYSKHGILLEGEARYLFGAHDGTAIASWTPLEDTSRSSMRFRHQWHSPHWHFDIAIDEVSDSTYYADFSTDSEDIALRNLPRRVALHYQNAQWEVGIVGEKFKTINYNGPPPHNLLPQSYARYLNSIGAYNLFSEWQYSHFTANQEGQSTGERFLWRGEATQRLSINGLTLRPQVGFHAVKYGGYNAQFVTPYVRLLAETGYRPFGWGDYHLRGMAAYAPDTRQDDAPLFDTTLRELESGGIYDWNRFTGGDRAADAQVASYGAEWRLWDDKNNREQFSLELAQRFYVRRPRVTLPFERTLPERGFANLLAAMKAHPHRKWRIEAKTEWNPQDNLWESTYADVRADFGKRRFLRFGGLFEEENNLLLGGALPLGAKIDMSFLLRYLGEEDRLSESEGALQIRSECDCWRVTFGARNIITAPDKTQKSYSIGFEFKGLGAVGSNRYERIVGDIK